MSARALVCGAFQLRRVYPKTERGKQAEMGYGFGGLSDYNSVIDRRAACFFSSQSGNRVLSMMEMRVQSVSPSSVV